MMKIIKRHSYKLEPDQLIMVGLGEFSAKTLCEYLNALREYEPAFKNYYFQVVSDNFEIK